MPDPLQPLRLRRYSWKVAPYGFGFRGLGPGDGELGNVGKGGKEIP